jgi:hypothetical protein
MECSECGHEVTFIDPKVINYKCCSCKYVYYYCFGCSAVRPECPCCSSWCKYCYGKKKTTLEKCQCGEIQCIVKKCKDRNQVCFYCKKWRIHNVCAVNGLKIICCYCVLSINTNVTAVKTKLNQLLCDPSRIVEDYLDYELDKDCSVRNNSCVKKFVASYSTSLS